MVHADKGYRAENIVLPNVENKGKTGQVRPFIMKKFDESGDNAPKIHYTSVAVSQNQHCPPKM